MSLITTDEVKEFLKGIQGKEVSLTDIRSEFNIERGSNSFDTVRNIMFRLTDQRVVRPVGKRGGVYRVLIPVSPVRVFGNNHKSDMVDLMFPKDRDTGMEFEFADRVTLRAGDLILIAGVSNYGKTALVMNFLAENIDSNPILLGNEFTAADGKPTPRFVSRLELMDWVEWVNEKGEDKFTLLPVMEDHAEYVIKGRLNLIDWINIETGEHYMINTILQNLKRNNSTGVTIAVIQKSEGATAGRGGQFTKDFADLELLIDKYSALESRLTIGKCKESSGSVTGRSWAFGIHKGVALHNIREVVHCKVCRGKGYTVKGECSECSGRGWVDK